jgi:hypothetical protein
LRGKEPERLVAFLDEFGLVERLREQMRARVELRGCAAGAVSLVAAGCVRRDRGAGAGSKIRWRPWCSGWACRRNCERGSPGEAEPTAPCDLAIPGGGERARIVVGMKGFNSTGSKLTDAVREIEAMAEVRLPQQYVFAVIDGIGWKSRQADLQRIYALWDRRSIDGLYTLAHLDRFEKDLRDAYGRVGIPLSI